MEPNGRVENDNFTEFTDTETEIDFSDVDEDYQVSSAELKDAELDEIEDIPQKKTSKVSHFCFSFNFLMKLIGSLNQLEF